MKAWYTLHSKPGAERQLAAALQERGIETYVPEIKSKTGQNSPCKKPLFPCYLFCRVDLEAVGLSRIQWTPGLRRVVAFGGKPAAMPQKVIDLLRARLDHMQAGGGLPNHPFEPGDTVRIVEGPFKDMLAIFEGPMTSAERVQVLLDILGRASRMHVDASNLVKTKDSGSPTQSRPPRRTRGRGRPIKH